MLERCDYATSNHRQSLKLEVLENPNTLGVNVPKLGQDSAVYLVFWCLLIGGVLFLLFKIEHNTRGVRGSAAHCI